MPDPVSSVGAHGGNVPFQEDIVESVVSTSASAANGHPSVPPPLEIVKGGEL